MRCQPVAWTRVSGVAGICAVTSPVFRYAEMSRISDQVRHRIARTSLRDAPRTASVTLSLRCPEPAPKGRSAQ
ncbi:MAG: hypothetical protein HWQ38_36345 [Nostoc sp. NMS7]|nr:hypothetical protein [Nostoc sp. NMS7]